MPRRDASGLDDGAVVGEDVAAIRRHHAVDDGEQVVHAGLRREELRLRDPALEGFRQARIHGTRVQTDDQGRVLANANGANYNFFSGETTTTTSTAPERTSISVISNACSPLSGCEINRFDVSTPRFSA